MKECVACIIGTFNDAVGSTQCSACREGSSTAKTASTSKEDCVKPDDTNRTNQSTAEPPTFSGTVKFTAAGVDSATLEKSMVTALAEYFKVKPQFVNVTVKKAADARRLSDEYSVDFTIVASPSATKAVESKWKSLVDDPKG